LQRAVGATQSQLGEIEDIGFGHLLMVAQGARSGLQEPPGPTKEAEHCGIPAY
jgi:hypothetical protein